MNAKAPVADFLAANQANMDAIHALAAEGLEHAARVAALNLATARAATADGARHAQALFGADDASALMKLQSAGLEPQIAHVVAYVRDIGEIATDAHQQFIEITQAWTARIKTSLDSAVSEVSSSASAGSGALFAALESATEVASGLYEKLGESSVQALDSPADETTDAAAKAARGPARATRAAGSESGTGSASGGLLVSDGER